MEKDARVLVTGTTTFLGSALLRQLRDQGFDNLVLQSDGEPDFEDAAQVDSFFKTARPDYVFLAAGESGGIAANQRYPASLMRDNLLVECNVIHSAFQTKVKKLLYLASSCCYPRDCPQPMSIGSLFTGPLEPSNAAYGTAKLAGIKLCEAYRQQYEVDFVAGIPANPFGPGDDFSPLESHVIPALISKFHRAKILEEGSVEVWGTGAPRREFIFVDDLADACIFAMENNHDPEPINLGGGVALSIKELAETIRDVIGFHGELRFDTTKPDGMPVKVLDSSHLLAQGWQPRTQFRDALAETYRWFIDNEHLLNLDSD